MWGGLYFTELVRLHKPQLPTYVTDHKTTDLGFKVLRLPPYHCHYKPGHILDSNRAYNLKDVKNLLDEVVVALKPDMQPQIRGPRSKSNERRLERLDQRRVQDFINLTKVIPMK